MKYTHYAPKGELTIVACSDELQPGDRRVIEKINYMTEEHKRQGARVGVLATSQNAASYQADEIIVLGEKEDALMISANLYRALRDFDEWGVDIIYSESFQNVGLGAAIMNRLMKAAGHRIIYV